MVEPLITKFSWFILEALGKLSNLSLPLNEFIFEFGSSYLSIPFIFLTYSENFIIFMEGA